MSFTLTEHHLELARHAGHLHASVEYDLGVASSTALDSDPCSTDEDKRTLTFRVTGEKLDLDSDEVDMIVTAYTDGYFDRWEDIVANGE